MTTLERIKHRRGRLTFAEKKTAMRALLIQRGHKPIELDCPIHGVAMFGCKKCDKRATVTRYSGDVAPLWCGD